jgi:elongation factor Ts
MFLQAGLAFRGRFCILRLTKIRKKEFVKMTVTAAQVKELRDKTGAGMMDAKKALVENNGDLDAALDWLRTKGIAKAAKKAGRTAAEGIVWAVSNGTKGAMVEVNSETDFSAKNEIFQAFTKDLAHMVLEQGLTDVDTIKSDFQWAETGMTVGEKLTELVAKIGENITLRRAAFLEVSQGAVGAYVHMGGKIGVLAAIESGSDVAETAKQLAMHVAASSPQCLTREEISSDILAREKAVYEEQARQSGKPDNVVEKIVEGRMNKFAEEICLVDQAFVMDTDRKVGQVVTDASADAKLTGFVRFGLGEGVEKKDEDFAAEVAKAANG